PMARPASNAKEAMATGFMTVSNVYGRWSPPKRPPFGAGELQIGNRRGLSGLARRALGKNPLQGAAMHVEPPRGLGDVAVAHLVDALDVFPAYAIRRHRVVRRLGFFRAGGEQG